MKSRIRTRSYIISVSLGTGCYRHIRISGKETLETLADVILWAFDFDNDHLHAFFMDNKAWSDEKCYSSPYAEDGNPSTADCRIQFSGLEAGQQFLFIFDFGDEWRFRCKVLKIIDEDTKTPEIVRSKGEAPQQYPDHDSDDSIGSLFEDDEENQEDDVIKLPKEVPVPVPDELYDAAFRFRKLKPWNKLYDDDIFAVRLSSGEIGYCCVIGNLGEYRALSLYIGNSGFLSYYKATSPDRDLTGQERFEKIMSQDCLQCCFANKGELNAADLASVKDYAERNNITFRGANSYPYIMRAKPLCIPWFITDESEFSLLKEALEAAIYVSGQLKGKKPEQIGFAEEDAMPCLTPNGEGFDWEIIKIPELTLEPLPAPAIDDETAKKLNELKKVNKWECRLLHMQKPVQNDPEETPFFPATLLSVECRNEHIVSSEMMKDYNANAGGILSTFADALIEYGRVPKTVTVADERTEYLLRDMCEKCSIALKRVSRLDMLDDIIAEMNRHVDADSFDKIMQVVAMLDSLTEEELRSMPPNLYKDCRELMDEGFFPPGLEEKFKSIFGG